MLAARTASAWPSAQHFDHVLERARAAAGDDGDADGFADPAGDDEVVAGFGAIGVDRVEHDLARAAADGFARPSDRVEAGRLAPAVDEDFPAIRGDLFASMETTMHWLPKRSAPALISSGVASALELMLILSAPACSMACMSSTVRMPPPTVSGMKQCAAVRSITSTMVARPCALAVMSKKTISSAPCSL